MTYRAGSAEPPRVSAPASGDDGRSVTPDIVAGLAEALLPMLKAYPHFVVLTGRAPTESRDLTRAVVREIASRPPVTAPVDAEGRPKLSFTRVQIDAEKGGENAVVTRYSRTNQPLELHTDSSYAATPHELVAFQMVRADADGGQTLMAAAEDVVDALDAAHLAVLRRPVFPFGRGRHAIIWGDEHRLRVRYYRDQIETALEKADPLGGEERAALAALDEALTREELLFRFQLAPGETLYMQNNKALHGRTGFAAASDRLMYRFRVNAGCLG